MEDLSVMPFVIAIPVYILIGLTIFDIVRRRDISTMSKALWIAAVVVLPVVGTFIYLLARPFVDPAHTTVRGNERTHAIVALVEQHEAGSIGDDEFAAAKHKVFEDAIAAYRSTRQ